MAKTQKKKMSKADRDKLIMRIMCGIMGGLMVLGAFAMIIQLI